MRKFRHIKQIVRNPPHDLTDLRIRIIGISKPLQMVKGILSHIRFYVHAHHMPHVRHKILRRRINQTQHKIQRRKPKHQRYRKRRQIIHSQVRNGPQDQRHH